VALHVALAAFFLPIVSLPLFWYAVRRERRWGGAILAVALVDAALLGMLLVAPQRLAESVPAPYYALGVGFEPAIEGRLVIRVVAPGSGAEEAGLLPGDELLLADGQAVRTVDEIRAAVQATEGERALSLVILRGADELLFDVQPTPAPPPRPGPPPGSPGVESPGALASALADLLPFVGVFLALLAAARRKSAPPGAAILVALFVALFAIEALPAFLPPTMGDGSTELLITKGVECLLLGALAVRFLPRVAPRGPTEPRPSARRIASTVALGVFYALTLGVRVNLVLMLLLDFAALQERASEPLRLFLEGAQGPSAVALRVSVVALLGPIEEELLFCGLLLGWLRRWMGGVAAVGVSALLFALLHGSYGPGMALILVYGAVLGWARIRSGGLLAPILLHVLLNGAVSAGRLL